LSDVAQNVSHGKYGSRNRTRSCMRRGAGRIQLIVYSTEESNRDGVRAAVLSNKRRPVICADISNDLAKYGLKLERLRRRLNKLPCRNRRATIRGQTVQSIKKINRQRLRYEKAKKKLLKKLRSSHHKRLLDPWERVNRFRRNEAEQTKQSKPMGIR